MLPILFLIPHSSSYSEHKFLKYNTSRVERMRMSLYQTSSFSIFFCLPVLIFPSSIVVHHSLIKIVQSFILENSFVAASSIPFSITNGLRILSSLKFLHIRLFLSISSLKKYSSSPHSHNKGNIRPT